MLKIITEHNNHIAKHRWLKSTNCLKQFYSMLFHVQLYQSFHTRCKSGRFFSPVTELSSLTAKKILKHRPTVKMRSWGECCLLIQWTLESTPTMHSVSSDIENILLNLGLWQLKAFVGILFMRMLSFLYTRQVLFIVMNVFLISNIFSLDEGWGTAVTRHPPSRPLFLGLFLKMVEWDGRFLRLSNGL